MSRQTHDAAKQGAKMILAQVCSSGDLRPCQFGAEIGFDKSDGFLDTLILDVEIPRIRMPCVGLGENRNDERCAEALEVERSYRLAALSFAHKQ